MVKTKKTYLFMCRKCFLKMKTRSSRFKLNIEVILSAGINLVRTRSRLKVTQKSSSKKSMCLTMELYTEVSGNGIVAMASACRYGPMELNMKETGAITKHRVGASFGMPMETSTMVSGKKTKHTVQVSTSM